jgi:hypothetical protein
MMAAVDEIRAAFERLHGEPALSQRGHQRKRDSSFANAARWPGDNQTLR